MAEAKRVVGTSATFFAGISVVMAITGLLICEPILVAMQHRRIRCPGDRVYAGDLPALPCLYMYAFVMSVLRARATPRPVLFMVLSVAIDIGLNPVFISGSVPFRGWVSRARRWRPSCRKRSASRRSSRTVPAAASARASQGRVVDVAFGLDDRRGIVQKGIPMSAQMMVLSLSGILMISIVNHFGVDTAAAFGRRCTVNYIQMPAYAVGMAVSSMLRRT